MGPCNRLRNAPDFSTYKLQNGFCQSHTLTGCWYGSILGGNSNRKICNNQCFTELPSIFCLMYVCFKQVSPCEFMTTIFDSFEFNVDFLESLSLQIV